MKKIFSIVLLAVFTFNLGGYYVVFKWLQLSAHSDFIQKLETDRYDENHTIELKVALSLPYSTQASNSFKRVDGRFEYEGNVYKLVKQKFEHDTLYIVCIKDFKEKQLINNFKEYAKTQLNSTDRDAMTDRCSMSIIYKFSPYQFHQASIEAEVPTPPPQV